MSESALPPLNWLRAFEASARHLSFTGAAQELGMTQSAISQQIKSLEGHMGRQLFFRRVRRLELTEVAKGYLPVVQEAFATLAQGMRSIVGDSREQVLQVQSNLAFSVHWLAPRLNRLFALHPWLRLNISTALWEPERTAPAADVEIRFGISPGEGVKAERLSRDFFFPVMAPDGIASINEISRQNLFDCAGLSCTWQAWLSAQGREMSRAQSVTYASTFAVSLSAAEAGCGLAMAHHTIADGLIASGRLIKPFEFEAPMEEAYFLIAPNPSTASQAVHAFVGWLHDEMKTPEQ